MRMSYCVCVCVCVCVCKYPVRELNPLHRGENAVCYRYTNRVCDSDRSRTCSGAMPTPFQDADLTVDHHCRMGRDGGVEPPPDSP